MASIKQFQVLKNKEKPTAIKGRATIDQLVGAVSNEFEIKFSRNVIMKASSTLKRKLLDGSTDISSLEPYLHAVNKTNPSFHYKVERIADTDIVARVMIISPFVTTF